MNCPNCKNEINPKFDVCTNCGNILSNDDSKIIRIGRDSINDYVISKPEISHFHVYIKFDKKDNIFINDLDSSNGTYINGNKIFSSKVSESDLISFGGSFNIKINEIIEAYEKRKMPQISITTDEISALTIGRSNENDIVISNIKVSKKHALLLQHENHWYLEDLKSSNGTFINGRKIDKSLVNLEDSIVIGGACVTLKELLDSRHYTKIRKTLLSTTGLCYSVKNKKILDDINLTVSSGQFIGLIGPSGAGKTTLMLLLNGMLKPSSGDVQLNSQSIQENKDSLIGEMGYVPQDDIIHRELTVESSLKYAADLRFNDKYSDEEKYGQVNKVISELGLDETKDVLIGDSDKRGISGGQRKRVNLGHELLTEPNILFLDEPTSGLDPVTDYEVMNLLKRLSQQNKIVIITTHSITKRNFDILTHVIILTQGGKLAYYGPTNEAMNYFGVKDPEAIFEVMNQQNKEHWDKKFKESKYYQDVLKLKERTKIDTTYLKETKVKNKSKREALNKYKTLTKRYLEIKIRDKISTAILLLQAPLIALIISLVFDKQPEKINVYFFLVISAIFLGIQNSIKEIVSEQSIFKRENLIGVKIVSYIASKITVLSLLSFLQALLLTCIAFINLNLQITFINLFLILLLTLAASFSLGLFLSSLVKSIESANAVVPLIIIPQIILGGIVKPYKDMNNLVKFISDMMISRRSIELSFINEFKNGYHTSFSGEKIPGKVFVEIGNGFSVINQFNDIFFLVVTSFIFILLTLLVLRKKTQ